MSKHVIQYAHCTKFTLGQLDRAPFTQYEVRDAEIDLCFKLNQEEQCGEWIVLHDGQILAIEDDSVSAMAHACYFLMNQSRRQAEDDSKISKAVALCQP